MRGIKLQENQKQMAACLEEAHKEGLLFEIVDWALKYNQEQSISNK